jgi:hypothetical protein
MLSDLILVLRVGFWRYQASPFLHCIQVFNDLYSREYEYVNTTAGNFYKKNPREYNCIQTWKKIPREYNCFQNSKKSTWIRLLPKFKIHVNTTASEIQKKSTWIQLHPKFKKKSTWIQLHPKFKKAREINKNRLFRKIEIQFHRNSLICIPLLISSIFYEYFIHLFYEFVDWEKKC